MWFISKIDYRFYQKYGKIAYIVAIILLIAVLAVGRRINGAKRWLYFTDTLSIQPSELVKFLMIIFYAAILVKNRDDLGKYCKGFIKHCLLLGPVILLLILEPHFSASIVIIGIVSIMMIMAGCKILAFFSDRSNSWNSCNYCTCYYIRLSSTKSGYIFRPMEICNR